MRQERYKEKRLFLHYGDMTDALNLQSIIAHCRPDEVYNLAAQSHVQVSFEVPEYTANVDGLGTRKIMSTCSGLCYNRKRLTIM